MSDGIEQAAHDLNNLLTAIIGAADAMLARAGLDADTAADAAGIREGAVRGAALVRRFRGGDPGVPGFLGIDDAIRATARLLGPGPLALLLNDPGGHARMDRSQLDRVLLNLVANARQAMPEGGTVTLRTARHDVSGTGAIPGGDYVVISVADTGPGIPGDRIAQIFEPGFTTRRHMGGSGLGLASVRDIVAGARGFITVDSAEGHGTRFDIYLPREAVVAPVTPGRALLVEDDAPVRRMTGGMLRRAGWEVADAESAEAALPLLENPDEVFALMISDVSLPGMDGPALVLRARALRPDIAVILTSGYADDGSGGLGVVYLTKPHGQAELLDAVARAVGGDAG